MILYIILAIIIIYLLFFAFIKIKFPFWSKQPVFHYYNLFYWIYPPGIISNLNVSNNFINFKNNHIYTLENIPLIQLNQYYNFIKNYYYNHTSSKYIPSKKYIIAPLESNNLTSYIIIYYDEKLLFQKSNTIVDYVISGAASIRGLNITINKQKYSTYYVDNLCIHPNKRKTGISQQIIQTLQYQIRNKEKNTNFYLFKKEGILNIMVPLVSFKTYQFKSVQNKIFLFTPTRFKCGSYHIIEITPSLIHIFTDFIKKHYYSFDCFIIPDITNINHLLHNDYLKIYCVVQFDTILAIYIFKNTFVYENGDLIVECIASISNCTDEIIFLTGFNISLKKCSKKYKFKKCRIDEIADNHIIIKHYQNNNKLFEYTYPSAFYLYNYACHPISNQNCFILY